MPQVLRHSEQLLILTFSQMTKRHGKQSVAYAAQSIPAGTSRRH